MSAVAVVVPATVLFAAIGIVEARNRGIAVRAWHHSGALAVLGATFASWIAAARGSVATEGLVAVACGAACAVTDAQSGYIFDRVLAAGFAAVALTAIGTTALEGALIASAIAGGLRLLTRGRGIGLGDVKLAALLGFGLGPWGGAIGLWWAFVLGGIAATALLLGARVKRRSAIPFGPYLCAGACVALSVRV